MKKILVGIITGFISGLFSAGGGLLLIQAYTNIFKLNEKLYIAQRNNIYGIDEIDTHEVKQIMYKGLYAWLLEHKAFLELELQDNRNFEISFSMLNCILFSDNASFSSLVNQ